MLNPILYTVSTSKDSKKVVLKDNTGAYNVSTNPGGYGAPNLASPPTVVGFTFKYWKDTANYLNFVTDDNDFITSLFAAGATFDAEVLGNGRFEPGIQHVKYYVFQPKDTIVNLTQGSKTVSIVSGTIPTAFESEFVAVVFLDPSNVVKSNVKLISNKTANSFDIDTAWGDASVEDYQIMLATDSDLKVLFTSLATACISEKTGEISESKASCDPSVLILLAKLSLWVLSAKVKFGCKDYDGAHSLAVNAYKECNKCVDITCKTCS